MKSYRLEVVNWRHENMKLTSRVPSVADTLEIIEAHGTRDADEAPQ